MRLIISTCTLLIVATLAFPMHLKPAKANSVGAAGNAAEQRRAGDPIRLKSREFIPTPGIDSGLPTVARNSRHGLIQLTRTPILTERDALRRAGVALFSYIPNHAFLARLPADVRPLLRLPIVRYIGPLQPNDKTEPRILKEGVNPYARNRDGTLRLSVLFFEDVPIRDAVAVVGAHGGRIIETLANFHLIRADFPEKALQELLAEDTVQWVEDVFENKIVNDGARASMGVDLVQAAPYNLDGTGSIIGEWDGGHAIDTANVIQHQDLAGRVTRGDTNTAPYDAHATHVAGTAIGSGLLSASQGGTPFQWKGMAPNATLIAYDWFSFPGGYSTAIGTYHIDISTNSWIGGANGNYDQNSTLVDQIITGSQGKRISIFWAAGNQRRNGSGVNVCDIDLDGDHSTLYDAYDCIANHASAKNVITVGAINTNDDSMTDFSSWGPTSDGRLKPEIVGPGCGTNPHIKSTVPGGTYATSCGTSMATPAASGSAAVLLQRFRQLCPSGGGPLPSTVKALLIHGARDLDDSTAWYNRGPDFASGYGRLDLLRSVDLIPFHVEDAVPHLGVKSYPIVVAAQQDLKVTLVWDDTAGTANASDALINDLDLELVDPLGGVHLPWVLDPSNPQAPATRGVDSRNVVEQVVVDNVSSALAGTWTIRVKGTNVPSLSQQFSLVSELLQATSCAGPTPAADLWGADTPLDTGVEPNPDTGPMWISDDIRVRHAPVDGPHENPEFGQTNYVFITVRNRGTQTGPYARVFLYWANASTGLSWPIDWNQLGSATAVNVPAGGSTVVGPIPWDPIATGHFCLYARMITHNEPIVSESADINANTQLSNQIIWKNTTVVDILAVQPEVSFIVRNPRFKAATFNLVFAEPREQLRDPFLNRGEVIVDLGKPLYKRWQKSKGKQHGISPVAGTTFRLINPRRAEILGLPMNAREEFTVRMRFSARELPPGASYRIDVTQEPVVGRKAVGGVSFRLQAGRPNRP